jgi:hypothetical protein
MLNRTPLFNLPLAVIAPVDTVRVIPEQTSIFFARGKSEAYPANIRRISGTSPALA